MSYVITPILILLDFVFFFFFNDTATTEIYTLSLHDALPIAIPQTVTRAGSSRRRPIVLRSARRPRATRGRFDRGATRCSATPFGRKQLRMESRVRTTRGTHLNESAYGPFKTVAPLRCSLEHKQYSPVRDLG